jgi:hypothetical protein
MVIAEAVTLVAPGVVAAALLQITLRLRPVKPKLPDPRRLGLPMAGPASPKDAHDALTGRRRR